MGKKEDQKPGQASGEQPAKKKEQKPSGAKKGKGGEAAAAGGVAQGAAKAPAEKPTPARLRLKYRSEVVPKLMTEFGYKNAMQVPRVEKIVINMGLGEAIQNPKIIDAGVEQVGLISGQRPVVTRSKKAIANFKLRANLPIGCVVTLRGERMYEFLDRLVNVALPRVRDFKGVSVKSFDGKGNYTLGVKEQIIFPEINYDKVEKVKGLNVCIATTAKTDAEARSLLALLGVPFRS